MMVRLLEAGHPIDGGEMIRFVEDSECGGVVQFSGVVRGTEAGRPISSIIYEHHPQMALQELERVVAQALGIFEVQRIACFHRTGRVPVGEASVMIVAGAQHRAAAFDACEFVIDLLKQKVPIWKQTTHLVTEVDGDSVGGR
jgi:molybdopterin synthase catalytic subunit